MQSSPNSALLAFPLGEHLDLFTPFLEGWLNYQNVVIETSSELDEARRAFPRSILKIEVADENLFSSTPLISLLFRTGSKRVYFIGRDLTGRMETNIRVAYGYNLDPVLVWDSEGMGAIPDHDISRIGKYCEVHEVSDFVAGFERGWVDFRTPPKKLG